MTQEVQPLSWSKRTNIEEHQQFFSKINEIISNLAPTVDEAEQAIAQATAAIASANDAVATANAASAAASAAASQAQTAASTVAGYDGRLTAAEGGIDSLQAADQTIIGNVAALETRMTAAESKNSQQDTAIAELQTADGQNVKIGRINEYAVGLTGNQNKTGVLGFFTAPKSASLYERIGTAGDWIIGKIPIPAQTIVINAIAASRDFNGIQLWVISVLTDGRITVSDQLGGTPPTIKHMIKDDKHYLAVTTTGNNVHYSIKWFMCRMGGGLTYMETTDLPVLADSSYVDVNA